MRCENCKFFICDKNTNEYNPELGACSKVKYIDSFMVIHKEKVESKTMYSCSEYGDATDILISKDFGCINFESKQ